MSDVFNMLSQLTDGETVRHISRQIGADEETTARAISGALPMLLGALARNASSSGGAESLHSALRKDHDGTLIENPLEGLGLGAGGLGDGILRHVLGGKRSQVESGLGQLSGLDSAAVGKLLAMLAPLVMGALGKEQRRQDLNPADLSSVLEREREKAARKAPDSMGMLGQLLDADGDGEVLDDVARMGMGFLGKMLKRR